MASAAASRASFPARYLTCPRPLIRKHLYLWAIAPRAPIRYTIFRLALGKGLVAYIKRQTAFPDEVSALIKPFLFLLTSTDFKATGSTLNDVWSLEFGLR